MNVPTAKEWFDRFPALKEPLFSTRFRVSGQAVCVTAWQGPIESEFGHTRLFCQLRVDGKVLFPQDRWHVGIPVNKSIDGKYAKELSVSLFESILPDAEDDEYTAEQRAWVERHGEELQMLKIQRFGEEPSR